MKNRGKPVTTFISQGDIRTAGIRMMSALLREHGWASNIVVYKHGYSESDIPTSREEDLLIGLLRDLKTDIAGLSVNTPFFRNSEKITKRIREEVGALVVWGGIHPTVMPEESFAASDVLCMGEGEYPMLELVSSLAAEKPIEGIRNLWIKTNGKEFRNPVRPLMQTDELDRLPFPDCGGDGKYLINEGKLVAADPLTEAIEYYCMASRGCPYSCSYCVNHVLKDLYRGSGPFIRRRTPSNVIDEIVRIKEKFPAVKRIRFQDEVFPWNRDWVERFCDEYHKRVGLPFVLTFHPNNLDEDVIARLKKAGLKVVGFGMQSPSEKVRREVYRRPETDGKLLDALAILHRQKLEGFYDIILDNPFETEEDRSNGLEFLLKVPKPFGLAGFSLKFFPGYRITDDAIRSGLIDRSESASIGEKGYLEFYYDWYAPKRKRDVFWNCLYLLASRSVVPRFLVRHVSRMKFFRDNPHYLILLAKISWYPELAVIAIRRVVRGQLNPVNVARVMLARKRGY